MGSDGSLYFVNFIDLRAQYLNDKVLVQAQAPRPNAPSFPTNTTNLQSPQNQQPQTSTSPPFPIPAASNSQISQPPPPNPFAKPTTQSETNKADSLFGKLKLVKEESEENRKEEPVAQSSNKLFTLQSGGLFGSGSKLEGEGSGFVFGQTGGTSSGTQQFGSKSPNAAFPQTSSLLQQSAKQGQAVQNIFGSEKGQSGAQATNSQEGPFKNSLFNSGLKSGTNQTGEEAKTSENKPLNSLSDLVNKQLGANLNISFGLDPPAQKDKLQTLQNLGKQEGASASAQDSDPKQSSLTSGLAKQPVFGSNIQSQTDSSEVKNLFGGPSSTGFGNLLKSSSGLNKTESQVKAAGDIPTTFKSSPLMPPKKEEEKKVEDPKQKVLAEEEKTKQITKTALQDISDKIVTIEQKLQAIQKSRKPHNQRQWLGGIIEKLKKETISISYTNDQIQAEVNQISSEVKQTQDLLKSLAPKFEPHSISQQASADPKLSRAYDLVCKEIRLKNGFVDISVQEMVNNIKRIRKELGVDFTQKYQMILNVTRRCRAQEIEPKKQISLLNINQEIINTYEKLNAIQAKYERLAKSLRPSQQKRFALDDIDNINIQDNVQEASDYIIYDSDEIQNLFQIPLKGGVKQNLSCLEKPEPEIQKRQIGGNKLPQAPKFDIPQQKDLGLGNLMPKFENAGIASTTSVNSESLLKVRDEYKSIKSSLFGQPQDPKPSNSAQPGQNNPFQPQASTNAGSGASFGQASQDKPAQSQTSTNPGSVFGKTLNTGAGTQSNSLASTNQAQTINPLTNKREQTEQNNIQGQAANPKPQPPTNQPAQQTNFQTNSAFTAKPLFPNSGQSLIDISKSQSQNVQAQPKFGATQFAPAAPTGFNPNLLQNKQFGGQSTGGGGTLFSQIASQQSSNQAFPSGSAFPATTSGGQGLSGALGGGGQGFPGLGGGGQGFSSLGGGTAPQAPGGGGNFFMARK